jgi:hypothetical protein
MPLIIGTFVLAVVLGLIAPRRVALGATAVAAVGTLVAFTWSVADGIGSDPWWLLVIAAGGGAVSLAVANALSQSATTPPHPSS